MEFIVHCLLRKIDVTFATRPSCSMKVPCLWFLNLFIETLTSSWSPLSEDDADFLLPVVLQYFFCFPFTPAIPPLALQLPFDSAFSLFSLPTDGSIKDLALLNPAVHDSLLLLFFFVLYHSCWHRNLMSRKHHHPSCNLSSFPWWYHHHVDHHL